MKLSEAIRLGAMLRPQAFGAWFSADGTCAMGAAMDAVGLTESDYHRTWSVWPNTLEIRTRCPESRVEHCTCGPSLSIVMQCLNDIHRWPREAIADWVEIQEKAWEDPQPVMRDAEVKRWHDLKAAMSTMTADGCQG